ncbi:hypothetical protein DFJ77DRAFT_27705 [Powellomyces hirtus]|nr:hypothetical protein DFJ77DRAFT_27705 [Powellomyces hirtus]
MRRRCVITPISVCLFLCFLLILQPARAANTTIFCKCHCPPNSTILTVSACPECSKDFCVERGACFRLEDFQPPPSNTIPLPTSTPGSEEPEKPEKPLPPSYPSTESWKVECYQLGSYKDELIIYSFIMILMALLGYAATKDISFRVSAKSYCAPRSLVVNRFANPGTMGRPQHLQLARWQALVIIPLSYPSPIIVLYTVCFLTILL